MAHVIKMPAGSESAHSTRKVACLFDLLPDILPTIKAEICQRWKRGVRIKWLASEYRLTVAQVEAVVWEPQRNMTPPSVTANPTVMEARGLHVVSRRMAERRAA